MGFGACAGVEAGVMHATGFGVDHPGAGSEPWIAPVVGLRARVPIGDRFAMTAGGDVLVPLDRPEFLVPGVGDVYRPPAVTGRLLGGVEIRLR